VGLIEMAIIIVVLGLAVFLDVVATWMVLRSVVLSRFQKVAQTVLIWIVPFAGAIAVISILTDPKDRERRQSRRVSSGDGSLGVESDLIRCGDHVDRLSSRHGAFDGHGEPGGDAGHGGDGGGH
jgi:hypothetical protein